MSKYFLSHDFLGDLSLVNIYEEYDGPKIFSLENQTGSTFIAYWIGDSSDYENWFIIPCSRMKIISFEKKKIDLLALLTKQEQNKFYKVQFPFDPSEVVKTVPYPSQDINHIKLPRAGLYAEKVKSASLSAIDNNIFATHEVIVSKSNKNTKNNILLEQMSKVCANFSNLAKTFNETRRIKGSIQPLTARYGSFAISLHAEELEKFELVFSKIAQQMIHLKDISSLLKNEDIDVRSFCELLESIFRSSIDFELRNFNKKDETIVIHKHTAQFYLNKLSKLSLQYISSIRVPQADSLERVFKVVEIMWQNEIITSDKLKVVQRHVDYYTQAAIILGLISDHGTLTTLGERIALATSFESKMRIAAHAFEASDCCWAWMNYKDVTKLTALDAFSSLEFLQKSCPSLSHSTAVRRARTLTTWHNKLKPFYQDIS